MKYIYFSFFFLLPFVLFSQTNTFPLSGNVGIGTLSPISPLTVNGDIQLLYRTQALLSNYVSFSETSGGASTIIGNNVRAGTTNNTVYRNVSLYDNGSFIKLNYYYGISFHVGVTSPLMNEVSAYDYEAMRITHDGNVGIGTGTPSEKLSVNGKIRAKEVKVELSNWPDYVFENPYDLMPLSDLEKFITVNKHLPNIPTATEVVNNGIELGEMNKKLLEKIEEMTLYIIQQGKDIEQLKQTIKTMVIK